MNRFLKKLSMALAVSGFVGSAWAEERPTGEAELKADKVACPICEAAAKDSDGGLNDDFYGNACGNACGGASQANLCGIYYDGYLNAGGMFNDHGANYNLTHNGSDNTVGLDGAYLAIVKEAKTGCGNVDWGFGADAMFGRDARFLSGYTGWDSKAETGHSTRDYNGIEWRDAPESYGFAVPQLYGEASINNWVFKGGRFYTLLGYEGARADQRFFYGFGRNFETTPITHSGALATFKGFENLDFTIGWVMGENNMFERDYDESLITGAVTARLKDSSSVKYAFLSGDGAMNGGKGDLFRHDVVLQTKFNDRLETALVYNYGKFKNGEFGAAGPEYGGGNVTEMMRVFGTNNLSYQTWAGYLYYKLNDCWKIGNRLEWQKGTTNRATGGKIDDEWTNFAFGAHWTPFCNDQLVIRPEIRYDFCDMNCFGNFSSSTPRVPSYDDQLSLGFDILYKF